MNISIRSGLVLVSILCSCLLYSCAAVIIGAGAVGAGAFAYTKGKLSRMYASGYHETVDASINTLESLKIPVVQKLADELKTTISAKRPDGTPVIVEVLRVSPGYTEVAIRTGNLGVFEKKTSYQIHDYILNRLNKKAAMSSHPQGLPAQKPSETESVNNETVSDVEISSEINFYKNLKLTVYFDVNTNNITGKETEKLDHFLENLDRGPNERIIVIGYSDASGGISYNKMLSLNRAKTVQMYLIGKGVSGKHIETYGYGPLNFVSTNATEEGRRLNRRVEIYLEKTSIPQQ